MPVTNETFDAAMQQIQQQMQQQIQQQMQQQMQQMLDRTPIPPIPEEESVII